MAVRGKLIPDDGRITAVSYSNSNATEMTCTNRPVPTSERSRYDAPNLDRSPATTTFVSRTIRGVTMVLYMIPTWLRLDDFPIGKVAGFLHYK